MRDTAELLAEFFGAMSRLPMSERAEAYKAAIEAVRQASIVVVEEPREEKVLPRHDDPFFMALVRGVKRRRSAEKKKRKRNLSKSNDDILQGLEQFIVEVGGDPETLRRDWMVGTQQCGSAYYIGPNNIRARSRVEVARIMGLPTTPPVPPKKSKKPPAAKTARPPPGKNAEDEDVRRDDANEKAARIRTNMPDIEKAELGQQLTQIDEISFPIPNQTIEVKSSVVEHLLMSPPPPHPPLYSANNNSGLFNMRQSSVTHFETRQQHAAPFQLPSAVSADDITQSAGPPPSTPLQA